MAAYYSPFDSYPPIIGHFGVGLHQRVAKYLALRSEVQLVTVTVVPIGARLVAGLSVNAER